MQPALTPTRLVLRPLAADYGPHLADIFAGAAWLPRDRSGARPIPY